jgi:signal transduction histidine kinase
MHISIQDIGTNMTKLSECRYALMLGVQTSENRLADFLQFSCAILNIENSLLIFKNEPYSWHSSSNRLQIIAEPRLSSLKSIFQAHQIFDRNDEFFQYFSDYVHKIGHPCNRLIAFQLQDGLYSLGQLYLYDESQDEIDQDRIILIEKLIENLVHSIRMQVDNMHLGEEYEQQVALNFSKNKYLQILSHDLRAPFHGLIGFTDVLLNERQSLTEDQNHEIVHYLSDTLNSTYNLLESVLKWSMADGGRFIYHPINFKLKEASSIVSSVLDGLAKKKGIEVIDAIPADIEVYADIHMMTSVLQNLVSNALKFSQPNKKCKVIMSAKVIDKHVYISVQDDGLGMSALQVDHLFEPDIKASVVGTSGEIGAGLGLMLCKRFVELNLGVITVVSEQNIGSTFTISLPISLATIDPNDNLIVFINKP